MSDKIERAGLQVHPALATLLEDDVLPVLGRDAGAFWRGFAAIAERFAPRNRALLQRREELQAQIDEYKELQKENTDALASTRRELGESKKEFSQLRERVKRDELSWKQSMATERTARGVVETELKSREKHSRQLQSQLGSEVVARRQAEERVGKMNEALSWRQGLLDKAEKALKDSKSAGETSGEEVARLNVTFDHCHIT